MVGLYVMYLERIPEWEERVRQSEAGFVVPAIHQGNERRCRDECGPLQRFPHYSTIAQNDEENPLQTFDITDDYKLLSDRWTNLTDLTTIQVTTLLNLQAYAAVAMEDDIKAFLESPVKAGGPRRGRRRSGGPALGARKKRQAGQRAGPRGVGMRQQQRAAQPSHSADHPSNAAEEPAMEACCGQCAVDAACGPGMHARHVGGSWKCFDSLEATWTKKACIDNDGAFVDCLGPQGAARSTLFMSHRDMSGVLASCEGSSRPHRVRHDGAGAWMGGGPFGDSVSPAAMAVTVAVAGIAVLGLRAMRRRQLRPMGTPSGPRGSRSTPRPHAEPFAAPML